MNIFERLGLAVFVAMTAAAGCAAEPALFSEDAEVIAQAPCTARFHWLQKDAYKSTAGRTTELWPAHTTTELEIVCPTKTGTKVVSSSAMENHGTKVGAVDANGDVILVETKVAEITGSRGQLEKLAAAYRHCDCDGATKFLSLDSLDANLAKQLLAKVEAYLGANLECPEGTDAILRALNEGRIDDALAALPECTWKDGKSLEAGLDEAMATLAAESKQELGAFHVCNNDAELQADLFATFAASGKIRECDSGAPMCHGPAWFYAP